jgi:alpha-glucosidase
VNQPEPRPPYADWHTGINQPEVHGLYRSWRRLAHEYGDGRVFVGEIVLEDQAELAKFVRPDELQLAFNFTFLFADLSAEAMRATIDRTLSAFDRVDATATWVLENHDVTRAPTRYGGGEEGRRRARAAALLLLALPGTAFLYAGQELGLEEVELPDELRQDPIFFRTKGERAGRDGCRVPIPWTDEPPAYGFTTGAPWLPMPAEWASTGEERAAARAFYRTALELRRSFADAPFAWRESPPGTLAFDRGDVTCLVGFDGPSTELPDGELLLSTGTAPDGAAWIRRR